MVKFTVEGKPVGKARPRVTRNRTYNNQPKRKKTNEQLVQWSYKK